jgi:hypothetical protein
MDREMEYVYLVGTVYDDTYSTGFAIESAHKSIESARVSAEVLAKSMERFVFPIREFESLRHAATNFDVVGIIKMPVSD